MNQTSHANNWPDLLVNCIIGSCAGLIVGVLLPIEQISGKVALNASEVGPGQSAIIGGIFGILCGLLFFFSRSDSPGYKKPITIVLESCTPDGVFELQSMSSASYVAFVDPSGGSSDSMTLAIAHRDKFGDGILDCIREVRPPFSPESVVDEFCATLKSYRVAKICGDRYAGEWAREPFRKRNVAYELSERPKSDIYRDLLPLLNSRKVQLLDDRRLISQLHGLERRTARGGRDSIDHGPGAHDDIANAVAGALLLAVARTPMIISDAVLQWAAQPAVAMQRELHTIEGRFN